MLHRLGPALLREGPLIEHITALRVVVGNGDVIDCNAHEHSEVFHAALGGLGQCGVIVRVTVAAVPRPSRARVYRVVTSFEEMKRVYALLQQPQFAKIRNFQTFAKLNEKGTLKNFDPQLAEYEAPPEAGDWIFLHEFVCFYDNDEDMPKDEAILHLFNALSASGQTTTDMKYEDWIFRLDKVFGCRASAHKSPDVLPPVPRPWFEAFFTGSHVQQALDCAHAELLKLDHTNGDVAMGTVIIFYPLSSVEVRNSKCMKLRVHENHGAGVYFGTLRLAADAEQARDFDLHDRELHRELLRRGLGCGYFSSTAPRDSAEWRMYYGNHHPDIIESLQTIWKKHDPQCVFSWRCSQE